MKTTMLLPLMLLFFISLCPVQAQDCGVPTFTTELSGNNVRAGLRIGGDLWWDGEEARYIVPAVDAGSGLPEVSAIFAGGIWIAGSDLAGNLKLAAQTYGSGSGITDYFPGPLSNIGTTTQDQCDNFDRFWKIEADEIDAHIADFGDNGIIDNPISRVMAWPGRGNPEFESMLGFELPLDSQGAAPFTDTNGNGLYEPNAGDYPNINGASQANWFVFNDGGGVHASSGGNPIQMEVQVLAYSYNSNEDAINDATFYDYKFINRAIETIDDTYISIWVDADLGCYTDDYIGCFPEDDLAFVYNVDAQDGDSGCTCPGGVSTYCDDIPVVGVKVLEGVFAARVFGDNGELEIPAPGEVADTIASIGMTSFMYYNGVGGPIGTTGPENVNEFYNYMRGSFRDGLPLTLGGDGHNPGSEDFTNYAFPGNPSDANDWSMCSENLPVGDRRMLINSGPFTLEPGAVNRMSFAVIYKASVAHPCPDMTVLQEVGNTVLDFWQDNATVSTKIPIYQDNSVNITPNPFTNQTQLLIEGGSSLQQVQLYSTTGQLVRSYNGLSTNSLTIEKGNLTPGMYIYKVLAKDGKAFSGKLVVR